MRKEWLGAEKWPPFQERYETVSKIRFVGWIQTTWTQDNIHAFYLRCQDWLCDMNPHVGFELYRQGGEWRARVFGSNGEVTCGLGPTKNRARLHVMLAALDEMGGASG